MENLKELPTTSPVDLAKALQPGERSEASSLHRATFHSSLSTSEALSHTFGDRPSNHQHLSTPISQPELGRDWNSETHVRSLQLSVYPNKATLHDQSTPNPHQDTLTGMAADNALVGNNHRHASVREGSAKPRTGLPDLTGVIDDVTMPRTINPRKKDDKGQIKVDVTNRGNAKASGPLAVNIYASPDLTLDPSDQLLDTINRGNVQIQPNNTRKFTFDFTNPAGVAPGAYYLIVDIDPAKTIAESNDTNNAAHQRVSASGTDVVLDWNATILNAIVATQSSPPVASRNMAIMHAAIYDAVNTKTSQPVSREAAVAAAAYRVLLNLYPTEAPVLKEQLDMSLAEIANGQSKTKGLALGRSVADSILAKRSTDGSGAPSSYTPRTDPGHWQPTSAAPALLPQWGSITPFTLQSGAQFRPGGPPALNSAEYAADVNQIQAVGSANSTVRTPDQTETALFWADGARTFTPPGHWNLVAEQLAVNKKNTLAENASLFALLDCAEADAGIVAWDAKYTYDLWRPVTAIHRASEDGNNATIADPNWTPLIATPPFPEYVSGHSTFSGAASRVLASVFGDNTSFDTTSIGLPGVVRSFTSFTQAADEAGMSRVYGGIHFGSANRDGLAMGRAVGQYTVSQSPFRTQLEIQAQKQKRSPQQNLVRQQR